ncbi:MAG: DNA primase [Anaeromyxobacter sp.]
MIPEAVIEQIRDRVDVVAVIGRHMDLKRSGRTWKGNCPFHGERTPSFHVYPEDKHYKCYGCGAYGNVFTFLQQLQGKDFPAVVRELAAECGIEIPEGSEEESAEVRRRRKERNELLAANDAAARYWAARLASTHGADARGYLERRGVTEESVRKFRLGIAADAWEDIAPRLAKKGVGEEAVKNAGLLVPRQNKPGHYDRFRGRLMFPIAAMDGQVIGFGGRAMGDEQGAKYLNTPETALYKKSKVLYGLDLARETIRKTRQAVLVEGYFDVIGLHQVGVANAVAVCGTALTPEHVELLARLDCREITVLFDGDSAGLAAPGKAAAALLPAGMNGRVAMLPADGGKTDPDDYARANGRAGVEALLKAATPLSQFLVDRAVEKACGDRPAEASLEAKVLAVRELAPYVRMTPEGLARSVFEDTIAKKLDLDVQALRAELSSPADRPRSGPGRPEAQPAESGPRPGPAAPQRQREGGRWEGKPWEGRPRQGPPAPGSNVRARAILPGPAADALALLAAFPEAVAGAAEEENLPGLLPAGPLSDLARDLMKGPIPLDEVLDRVAKGADEATLRRVRGLTGPGRPEASLADREFRKAAVKAHVAAVEREYENLLALVAKAGSPIPEDLAVSAQIAARKKSDLEKRLRALERAG